jgi:RsiW-degrading membrane proteinase PrsW (M82 family)
MNNILRLLIVSGLVAFSIAIILLGLARHSGDLLAPFNLILLAVGIGIYFLPTMLALYRNCHATSWIVIVNVLLGWTIVGWFAVLGWAATGKADTLPPTITTPPGSPITGH